jgi:transketolase
VPVIFSNILRRSETIPYFSLWLIFALAPSTVQGFGASAPYKVLEEEFGFTVANVVKTVREML